ncbi:MAG: acyltransferase [Anaerolineae bacterium]
MTKFDNKEAITAQAEPVTPQPDEVATQASFHEPDILQTKPQAEFEGLHRAGEETPNLAQAPQPDPAKSEENLEYVRVIRAMALIVIVAEHLAFPLIYEYNSILVSEWWIGTGIYLWGKAGSPLFTMVSGLLLLNPSKDQPLKVFFKKRFMKVLIPFLAWSVIYLVWEMAWVGSEYTAREIVVKFVEGPVFYHLWFIQMILGLYLATPIMRIYIRHAPRENIQYFLLVWAIGTALFPMVRRFFGFDIGIDIFVTAGFMGYFVLGYYLRSIKLNREQMVWCLAIMAGFILLTQFLTHWLTAQSDGQFDNFFTLNTSFNVMVLATCFFLFIKSLDYEAIYARYPIFKLCIKYVAQTSLGLYFIHVMIIEELRSGRLGIELHGLTWNPLIAIPLITVLVMGLSVAIIRGMQQIPHVKKIVP